ncbi:hypothetical protein SAMN03080615_02248 [Amphritea atlantica]|uniref:Uncharacterized protein n=2 Tax=Amphritea atlantica TaxID=355243 RepID=A0A1H9HVF4_9GAMM|nr:hypothetical protein SAMN03080615_02248 [Amphritea atlantica]
MMKLYDLTVQCCALVAAVALFPVLSTAGEADVMSVTVSRSGNQQYDFSVTLKHDDTGWEHYADRWEVVDIEGHILATRALLHPHVNEQPFTRSLRSVTIPAGIVRVNIRAHDRVHHYGGAEISVDLPE